MGKNDEALQAFSDALRVNPYYHSRYGNPSWPRGELLAEKGRFAEALEDFDRAIDIDPRNASAHSGRAAAHFNLENYDQALADTTKAFELNSASTLTSVGVHEIAQCPDERYRQGVLQLLAKAIGRPETAIDALRDRAGLYLAMHRNEDALSDVESARALLAAQTKEGASDNVPTTLRRASLQAVHGFVLNALGRGAEAEPVLRECLALRQQHDADNWTTFNAMSLLGEALMAQKKHDEAEALLLQAYEGIKQREFTVPLPYRALRMSEAAQRIVRLYEATEQPEKAREWQAKAAAKTLGVVRAEANELDGVREATPDGKEAP